MDPSQPSLIGTVMKPCIARLGLFLSLALTAASAAQAQDGKGSTGRPSYGACLDKSGGVTAAMQDCMHEEYAYQDKRLNRAYQILLKRLPPAEREKLRNEERRWIAQRDEKCVVDPEGGTAQLVEAGDCRLVETIKRADELEAR